MLALPTDGFGLERRRRTALLRAVPKWVKFIIGLLLLPVCPGAAEALWLVLRASAGGRGDLVWVPMLAGAACWLVVFLMLPKPMWLYVVGHELTHVVQQRSGPVDGTDAGGGVRVSDPSDRFEREAVANADRLMSAPPATPARDVQRCAADGGSSVQRAEAPAEEGEEATAQTFVQRAEDEGEEESAE